MDAESPELELLRTLLTTQDLAVVATQMEAQPYTSLVAFSVSRDLRRIVFATSRTTTKYRNLAVQPRVAMLIDSRTHSVEDFTSGAAVTAVGSVHEVPNGKVEMERAQFLGKHASLETFVQAPTTALCAMVVERYILVTRFQHVVDIDVSRLHSERD